MHRLPAEADLCRHIPEVRFTKAFLSEQLLRTLQYLLPAPGRRAGRRRGHHVISGLVTALPRSPVQSTYVAGLPRWPIPARQAPLRSHRHRSGLVRTRLIRGIHPEFAFNVISADSGRCARNRQSTIEFLHGLREGAALIYDDRVTAVVLVSEETGIDERLIGLSLNDLTEQATMPRDLKITRSALAAVVETMQDARHAFDPIRRPR
jgi:hypothetical protein